ncbi:MAG TPA: DUF5985 family protein [Candidatus Baltobacteraceae bacterium]|jgi:hypothetical protein
MAETVYIIGILTSTACTVLLLRGYVRSRVRLLLWSGLAFAGLTFNNVLLYVDLLLLPQTDLSSWRLVPVVVSLGVLCYGLIWEAG